MPGPGPVMAPGDTFRPAVADRATTGSGPGMASASVVERPSGEALAKGHLPELAGGRFRDLVDELDRVRERERRELRPEELDQLVLGRRCVGLQDDDRQRTLLPPRVGNGDDRR